MKTIELSTATKPLAEYAAELGDDALILTSHDKPVAALLSLDNLDAESLSLSLNTEFIQMLAEAEAEADAGKTISLDEMKREMGVD